MCPTTVGKRLHRNPCAHEIFTPRVSPNLSMSCGVLGTSVHGGHENYAPNVCDAPRVSTTSTTPEAGTACSHEMGKSLGHRLRMQGTSENQRLEYPVHTRYVHRCFSHCGCRTHHHPHSKQGMSTRNLKMNHSPSII